MNIHKPASLLTLALAAALAVAPLRQASAHDKEHEHNPGRLYGSEKLITTLSDIYFRAAFGNITLPSDANGNTVVGGSVLMPLPNAPGDGTPASISVTVREGQSLFLPLLALPGTSYSDGTPPDPFVEVRVLKRNLTLKLSVNGKTVLEERDAFDFYTQFRFEPPIPFDLPPLAAITYLQTIAVVLKPLPPGTHVIKLDEKVTPIPIFGGVEFHNTFNVTVLPEDD
jgi:hypothetical protein